MCLILVGVSVHSKGSPYKSAVLNGSAHILNNTKKNKKNENWNASSFSSSSSLSGVVSNLTSTTPVHAATNGISPSSSSTTVVSNGTLSSLGGDKSSNGDDPVNGNSTDSESASTYMASKMTMAGSVIRNFFKWVCVSRKQSFQLLCSLFFFFSSAHL